MADEPLEPEDPPGEKFCIKCEYYRKFHGSFIPNVDTCTHPTPQISDGVRGLKLARLINTKGNCPFYEAKT